MKASSGRYWPAIFWRNPQLGVHRCGRVGFTLIEVIVVIAIIAVVAALLYRCPDGTVKFPNGSPGLEMVSYGLNENLAGRSVAVMNAPAKTVLFFEINDCEASFDDGGDGSVEGDGWDGS